MKTLTATYWSCSRLLVLLTVLALSVSTVTAIPFSEYHEALDNVISDVNSLIYKDENVSEYESHFTETIEAIRLKLPKNQQVEMDHQTWRVDNTWLHTKLDELQSASVEERPAKLESLLELLRAVDERVAVLETDEIIPADKASSKQKMESILARPEYAAGARGPNALTRLIRDLIRWFEGLFPKRPNMAPGRANIISLIVQILIIATAVALILYVLRLLLIRFRRPLEARSRKKREPRIVLGERLQPDETAGDLLSEAEALARSGDLRAAIRKGYIALLVELGDRNVISLAQYKTNRDYLRSVSNLPQLHSRLKGLTESFERHWYGFAQVTPNDWQDFRAGYREALHAGN